MLAFSQGPHGTIGFPIIRIAMRKMRNAYQEVHSKFLAYCIIIVTEKGTRRLDEVSELEVDTT